ncbi:Uncharacterised protein [Pseudomonas fluorescens]|uniref:Uncharacterized protein n=1 Tax=Pseudomonas fluorescens TaxID=294 RepID=A0A379IIN9_PSEFL|nr:Uncharacterised protein [Pseudomonas fluorescens]
MCGLCGLLGEDLHWSDPLGDELPRRRERLRRIAAINQVLAVFRLKVEDFQGASYLLLGATGKQELASGLDPLWRAAERMLGRPLDPLDPKLLDHLEHDLPDRHCPVGARLAGDGVHGVSASLEGATAGKPAPAGEH